MFGPRWALTLPLLILVPLAALLQRRSLWLHALALGVLIFAILGLCVPWRSWFDTESANPNIRVLTCNVHGGDLDPAALADLIATSEPDLVVLQTWSSRYEQPVFGSGNWHLQRSGELLLASRYPILEVETLRGQEFDGTGGSAARFAVDTPAGVVNLFNVHLSSPRTALEAVYARRVGSPALVAHNSDLRRSQSRAVRQTIAQADGPVLIAGDFNTPVDSTIYRDSWSELDNAFSRVGFGFGNTYYTRHASVRIDHILAGPRLRCRRCWLGPDVGSPHRPVFADLDCLPD
jgi:endonuclease/exonuclease/phosphatase (EEP) superfamily protein YafD